MAGAMTELRAAVKATVEAEFASEGLTVQDDKLHESLGIDAPIAGVYPEAERPHSSGAVGIYIVGLQVFQRWDPQIDPTQKVDPAAIEAWAWRLQRRMRPESTVNGENISYYVVSEVLYPDDATGNKTRFVATLTGYGHNPSIMETTA